MHAHYSVTLDGKSWFQYIDQGTFIVDLNFSVERKGTTRHLGVLPNGIVAFFMKNLCTRAD
jgi:hypothetical protein